MVGKKGMWEEEVDAVTPEGLSEELNYEGRTEMGRRERRAGVGESCLSDEQYHSLSAGRLESRSAAYSWDAGFISDSCLAR